MKKLLLLVCAVLLAVSVNAADQKVTGATKKCNKKATTACSSQMTNKTVCPIAVSSGCYAKKYKKDEILTLVRVGKVDKKTVEAAKKWAEKSIFPPISVNVKSLKYSKKFADKATLFKELEKIRFPQSTFIKY